MAIRFRQSDARSMGRNSSGVRGIKLRKGDSVVGMAVADESATLLTICADGIGKRTPFGPNAVGADTDPANEADDVKSNFSYRTQTRGGFGLRDIEVRKRQTRVIGIVSVNEDDEMMMLTTGGKVQRVKITQIPINGRNTKGVRIMKVDANDQLVAINRIPPEQIVEEQAAAESVAADSIAADSVAADSAAAGNAAAGNDAAGNAAAPENGADGGPSA